MNFVHFGDLHLDHKLNGRLIDNLPFRVYDMLVLLEEVIDYANNNADFLLFSGDLYHRHEPKQEYKILIHEALKKLEIPAFFVVGNHDMSMRFNSKDALYELTSLGLPNVTVFHEIEFVEFKDFNLLAIPWSYRKIDLPEVDPFGTIVLAHCTVPELVTTYFVDSSEVSMREFIVPVEYLSKFEYAALGHIHNPNYENNVIYPGSVGFHTWGEFKDKNHFFVHHVNGVNNWIEYEDRKRYFTALITGKEELPEINEEGIYRFEIHNNCFSIPQLQQIYRKVISLDILEKYDRIEREHDIRFEEDVQGMTDIEILQRYYEAMGQEFDEDLVVEILGEIMTR